MTLCRDWESSLKGEELEGCLRHTFPSLLLGMQSLIKEGQEPAWDRKTETDPKDGGEEGQQDPGTWGNQGPSASTLESSSGLHVIYMVRRCEAHHIKPC